MNKSETLEVLSKRSVNIEFIKSDGTRRKMLVTLNSSLIEYVPSKSTSTSKKKNSEVQSVWDLDSNSWKAFRWNSLLTVDGIEFEETVQNEK